MSLSSCFLFGEYWSISTCQPHQPIGKKKLSIDFTVKPLQRVFVLTNLNLPSILATDPGARLWIYIPGELFSSVRQQAPMPSPTPGSVKNKKHKGKRRYSLLIVLTLGHASFSVPTSHLRSRFMYCFRAGLNCSQPGSQDQQWKSELEIPDPDWFLRSSTERNGSAPGKRSTCPGNCLGLEVLHAVWSGLRHKGEGMAVQ